MHHFAHNIQHTSWGMCSVSPSCVLSHSDLNKIIGKAYTDPCTIHHVTYPNFANDYNTLFKVQPEAPFTNMVEK